MKIFITAVLFLLALPAISSEYCHTEPFNPEIHDFFLQGNYEIVGKDATTGVPYVGHLRITSDEIIRTINGNSVEGHVFIQKCGTDIVTFLLVEYAAPTSAGASCRLGRDAINYYRITCLTDNNGENSWLGREAWFQKVGSAL